MPANTVTATTPRKNTIRLPRPSVSSVGCSSANPPMIAATTISASSVAGLGCARMRSRTVSARRPTHTGIAAARQLIEMSSDMIETIDSPAA